MPKGFEQVLDLWRREYSSKVNIYEPYKSKDQLRLFASLFAPGETYFYILNMHNLQLEYVSESIMNVLGITPEEATIEKIVSTALLDDLELLEKKEEVIKDFFLNFCNSEQRLDYKALYTYRMKDFNNEIKNMLHQVTVLSLDNNNLPQHAISIHTDISHVQQQSLSKISFMSLSGEKSYYNIDVSEGIFNPNITCKNSMNLLELLTNRELEIVKLLSKGFSTNQISDKINVSVHTVQTHRKNINKKTGFKNAAELIAICLMSGVI
ncbi:response regulator transcription factor [Formosa haliotis]|uniref:response regulator transcription factor n=1 Tax=Formosa haliotis TaxID=1555194 RepID=UPI0008251B63|nr:helix-turn-helix transcriptional regulator [Formosa haliotis]